VAARTQADTEFLARELSAVRLALADVVTTEDLGDRLSQLEKLIVDQRPVSPDRDGRRPDEAPGSSGEQRYSTRLTGRQQPQAAD
jgi:hypothetical protein